MVVSVPKHLAFFLDESVVAAVCIVSRHVASIGSKKL